MISSRGISTAENRHPGITMHKISFGGGFMGLLFAAGSALIFVLGFPTLWYFVALAFALGIGVAVLLRIVSKGRSERNKPLSILSVCEASENRKRGERVRWRKSFKITPGLTSA
ncbi:MAG: hypothetical protein LAP86_05935 [Acidobacteriia bacterium]|nr:hypothetical protein [Terriglobia bacterium]